MIWAMHSCLGSINLINGSWEETPVVVIKHTTCTYRVTSAASICMDHEAFVISTFFSYAVHVKSLTVDCVYAHTHTHTHTPSCWFTHPYTCVYQLLCTYPHTHPYACVYFHSWAQPLFTCPHTHTRHAAYFLRSQQLRTCPHAHTHTHAQHALIHL